MSIQAHESRREFFDYLRQKLGDVPFSVDVAGERNIGCWQNCKRAWLMYDPTADWHVVIQDDAIICDNFKELAEQFISEHLKENRVFNFYFGDMDGSYKYNLGDGLEKGFFIKQRLSWGVAICLPVKMIKEMIEFCDWYVDIPQDDVRLSKFCWSKRLEVMYPIPSLCDHRQVESLVGAVGTGRKAFLFKDNVKK